jgi:hypothetical protein
VLSPDGGHFCRQEKGGGPNLLLKVWKVMGTECTGGVLVGSMLWLMVWMAAQAEHRVHNLLNKHNTKCETREVGSQP